MSRSRPQRHIPMVNTDVIYPSLPLPSPTPVSRVERSRSRLSPNSHRRRPEAKSSRLSRIQGSIKSHAHSYRASQDFAHLFSASILPSFNTEIAEYQLARTWDCDTTEQMASLPGSIPGAYYDGSKSSESQTNTAFHEPIGESIAELRIGPRDTDLGSWDPTFVGHSEVDERIRTRIEMRLTEKQANNQRPGYVYIFQDPLRPGLLKIGTSQTIWKRQKRIQASCGIEIEVLHCSIPIFGEQRAEKLSHDELQQFNQKHPCVSCPSPNGHPIEHREWFKVPFSHALKVVRKWTNFLSEKPYGDDCELKDFWKDRLWNRRHLDQGSQLSHDCIALHERWEGFVQATKSDRRRYRWSLGLEKLASTLQWLLKWWRIAPSVVQFLLFGVEFLLRMRMFHIHFVVGSMQSAQLCFLLWSQTGSSPQQNQRFSPRRNRNGTIQRRSS